MAGKTFPSGGRVILSIALFGALNAAIPGGIVLAADWPHWRGPSRNGVTSEEGWLTAWPSSGLPRLWSANIGQSYAAVSVQGKRLYTIGAREGKETLFCLDAGSGAVLWRHTQTHPK